MHLLGVFIIALVSMASAQVPATSYAFGFPAASLVAEEYVSYLQPVYSQPFSTEVTSLPVDASTPTSETAEEMRDQIVADFNSRYSHDLEPPVIAFINKSRGEYDKGIIYIPYTSQYAISHETCHYFQDKTCSFESYGESFCEVFAGADRGKDECVEKGWPAYYCAPFRLSEVDRQGFLDCVFDKPCVSGGASKEELMSCYNKNKKTAA